MSNKPENKDVKVGISKNGKDTKPDKLKKSVQSLLGETTPEEAIKALNEIIENQKVENEIIEGGFLKMGTLHDLNAEKKTAELAVLQKTDQIRLIEEKMAIEHPNVQKTFYNHPETKKELGTACVVQGKANRDKVLISLAPGTLDLNSLVRAVKNYDGDGNMGNKSFRTARNAMYNNILEYLDSVGLVGRSPKDTNPKMAWLSPKGLKAYKMLKKDLESELED